jgi:GTP-binding protein
MIEGYLRKRAGLRAVVLLVDVRRGVEDEERQLVDFLQQPRLVSDPKPPEIVLVATKVDKLGAAARKPALEGVRKGAGTKPIGFSAVTGEGRDELWARIRHAALGGVG